MATCSTCTFDTQALRHASDDVLQITIRAQFAKSLKINVFNIIHLSDKR